MNIEKLIEKISHNWAAKVLSLVLAIFLFAFHHASTMGKKPMTAILNVHGQTDLFLVKKIPATIALNMRGDNNNLSNITDNDIEVYIDLSVYHEKGQYNVPIQIIKKGNALQVDPLEIDIEPSIIPVQLDIKRNKYVPVIANIQGKADVGYKLISYNTIPAQTLIEGAASLVDDIKSLTTDPIGFDGIHTSFSKVVNIVQPNDLITVVGNSKVEFNAVIQSVSVIREYNDISVEAAFVPEGFSVELLPDKVNLKLEGPEGAIDSIVQTESVVTIDCSQAVEDSVHDLPVNVKLPDTVQLITVEPAVISVTIKKTKKIEKAE